MRDRFKQFSGLNSIQITPKNRGLDPQQPTSTLCGILVGGQLATIVGFHDTLFLGVGLRLVVVGLALTSGAVVTQAGVDAEILDLRSSPMG